MFGGYLKRQGDEAEPVLHPEPSEPPATVKKRHSNLGKSTNRMGPVRLEFLLPEFNKLLESGKKERRSYGAHFNCNDHSGEWAQMHNTIPETVSASKNSSHNSSGLISSCDDEQWKVPPSVMVTQATPQKSQATPAKLPNFNQDTYATVSESEKENFTPLKVQKVPTFATPAASRGPLSLLSVETPQSEELLPEVPISEPAAPHSVQKGSQPMYSRDNFSASHTKSSFSRSRLYGTSGSAGPRAQHNLLPTSVPLHPMVAAAQHQGTNPHTGQQGVSSLYLSHGNPQRKSPEVPPATTKSTTSNFSLNCESRQHQLKPASEYKPVVSMERVPNTAVEVPAILSKDDPKEFPSASQREDIIKVPSEAEGVSTLKVLKQALPVDSRSNEGNVGLNCHPHPVLPQCDIVSSTLAQNVDIRAEPMKVQSLQPITTHEEAKIPPVPEVCALSQRKNSIDAAVQSDVVSAPKPEKNDPVFQVPKPVSNIQSKRSAGKDQIVINGKPYSVLSLLGRGGSSLVYQVLDASTSKLLAVKCVNLSGTDDSICNGYLNEIQLLAQLQDGDCVIHMYDFEHRKQEGILYVVMEKGDTDLSKLIKDLCRSKKISAAMILYYWIEMLSAVSFIHKRGTIHSDLKPANFLLVSGRLKLIDFGIASSIQGDMTSVLKDSMTGTYNYISPEALCSTGGADGQRFKITYKSDVWSLGCILYNLIYGQTPFQNIQGQFQKLNAIVNTSHKIPFPTPPIEDCPPVLIQALQSCLIRNPRERASVDELLRLPYLGYNGPERAILSQIGQLIVSFKSMEETKENENSSTSILKAIQNLIIENEASLPFLKSMK